MTDAESGCVFCDIASDRAPARIVAESPTVVVFVPLAPAAPGHLLVVPRRHVRDAAEDPTLTASVFAHAVRVLGARQGNILTSVGPDATQTVKHLHVHVVPRGHGDGLHEDWPWHRALYDGIRR